MPSSVPNCRSRSAAVLGPTPGTPGTLSLVSPVSARKSRTCPGLTPNFSRTSGGPKVRSRIESHVTTWSSPSWTSCMRSLSALTMTTRSPSASARAATAAMRSSASSPSFWKTAQSQARMISSTRAICCDRSGGGGGRVAL